ncbi:polysaccharide deacetylase family protein [Filibacter tadaridae]|uniref:Peptidoglycan-N-acetylglucosamine deacetylase n=1 Tax=Filibacter tadaridae TaxID=2483811 RepID=A0A3P5X4T6_9BACL|nr:polysaccharide deacetylase family protein [Filibacter tadaridae]VDC29894.1 Peptidoglycan-N-acetylglucosamine deacetylase [Filibacter tadaridae]
MKKQIVYVMAMLILLLAACAKEEPEDEKEPIENNDSVEERGGETEEPVEEPPAEEIVEEVAEPLYALNPVTYSVEPIGDANAKVVLLTIDDAPDKRALDMAKTLKRLDAPAIFFVNGHFLATDEKKEVLKEIHDMGFMIGNHTKTHANLKGITEQQQQEEILTVSDTVERVIGERPKFFRAPFGINTDFSRALAEKEGMTLMNWSFGYDWEKQYMDAEAIADIMVNTELLHNGSNLLMHDREWTADALEEIVLGLRAKGYDLVDPATIKVAKE